MLTRRTALTAFALGGLSVSAINLIGKAHAEPLRVLVKTPTGDPHWVTFSQSGSVVKGPTEVFSDRITGRAARIKPLLVSTLKHVQDAFGPNNPIEIIAGYVDPARLTHEKYDLNRREDYGVYMHTAGEAIDFRVPSVPSERIFNTLRGVHATFHGGRGLYNAKNFVHIDTGPDASWSLG